MRRHRVWSIGCSPRNALQFLWELNTEVTCQVGRCFNKHEAQQIKVQDWQLAAKMVPCKFTSTWSTGRGEKAVPLYKKRKEGAKGKGVNKLCRDWRRGVQLERWPLYLPSPGAAGVQ